MKTHQQATTGPDEATRAYTKALADLCKRDGALFAAVVRQGDQLRAQGVPEPAVRAWQLKTLATASEND